MKKELLFKTFMLTIFVCFAFLTKSNAQVSVNLSSGNSIIVDSNKACNPAATVEGPQATYVSYTFTNSGAATAPLTATLSFTNNGTGNFAYSLGGQVATQSLGVLEPGETASLFWFVDIPCEIGSTVTANISVEDNTNTVIATSAEVLTTVSANSANATGQTNSGTINLASTGQLSIYDVSYTFGNTPGGAGVNVAFQPVGNEDFDAACFQLVGVEVISSVFPDISAGTRDQLFFDISTGVGGSGNVVEVRYFFKDLCTNTSTVAQPYATGTSGGQFKYNSNFNDDPGTTFPPTTSPASTLNITKSVSETSLLSTDLPTTVTYTVSIENTSPDPYSIDEITDVLPAPFNFAGLDVSSDITATNASSIPAVNDSGTLRFIGGSTAATYPYTEFLMDGNSTMSLVYTVNIPNTAAAADYINSATYTTGGFTSTPATSTLEIRDPIFIQDVSGPWDIATNWVDNVVPTINDDAIIDAGVASYLTLDQAVNNLELRPGSTVSIPDSNDVLTVQGNIINDGDFTLYNANQNGTGPGPTGTNGWPGNVDGEVLLNNSTTAQTLSGTGNYYNLRVDNSNGVDVLNADTSNPTEVNGILYVDNGDFSTNDNVLFPCFFQELNIGDFSNGRAGQIGPILGSATITGEVTVEQCYPGRRAYRYVTSSVTTENSIHDNWQEGATAYNDQLNETELEQEDVSPLINDIPYLFGTHITGLGEIPGSGHTTTPAGGDQVQGLDWQASGNPSMFEFNETGANAQTFTPVLATEPNTLVAGKAYSMIIRGSRKVNLLTNASPTYNTKLRSTGQPVKGDYTFIPTVNDEQFLFVGNPFHSIVDMRRVVYGSDLNPSTPGDNSAGINRYMYIFDPTLGNENDTNPTSTLEGNRGAFVVIDLQGQFVPSNGEGGTGGTSLSSMGPYLQAYQGFFIQATANTQSLVFSETDKAVRQNQVNVFSTTPTDMVSLRLFDQVSYANNGTSKDYLAIKFGQNENSGVDYDDALKFTNHDENIGRLESNSYLTYENREMPQIGEVLELYTFNYRTTDYTFVVKVDGLLDKTVSLYDNYLNTDTVLNNDMSTAISFTVDPANPASTDPYRFELRFETSTLGNNEFDLQGISVYPNPASDILNINLGENTGRFESLELYDISGRLIATKNLNNNVLDVQMNVNGYSSGIYVLKVSSGAEQFSTKVIIE